MPLDISRGLALLLLLHVTSRQMTREGTNLKTLTDHPIFVTSLLSVPRSEARVSDVRVLESVVTQRCGRGASVGDHRTCKTQVVEPFFV